MISADENKKILVVDDSADLCRLITIILEAKGYLVESVNSGEAARARLLQNPGEFVVIISDVSLAGESGLSLLKWVKDLGMASKFILMSGQLQSFEMDAKEDTFLLKPFTREQLLQTVEQIRVERKVS